MSEGPLTAAPTTEELSRASIGRVDASDQLGDVLALPEHLRDALWRAESAIMQDWDTPAGLVVAGLGGSAIGGALARAALGDHASRPIFVTRAYGLPTWTTPDTMVLCASYSGDTEETLACYESAAALGGRLHDRRRARGRRAVRRRTAADRGDRRGRVAHRAPGRGVGARRAGR